MKTGTIRAIVKPPIKTAILVDGGFYRKRANSLFGEKNAQDRAAELADYCLGPFASKKCRISLVQNFLL